MKVVVLGATKGMGRAVARKLAQQGTELFLLGRNTEELERSARDLEAHGASSVGTGHCDLAQPESFAPALDRADVALGDFDTLLITAGVFGTQEGLEADRAACQRLLQLNFTNTILLCEEARERLLQRRGTLCVFSSVAGDRARKPVVLYGATKAGLSYYLEGLDHRYRDAGLRVICIKPGFVKTGMTAGLEPPPFAGEPEDVAEVVYRALVRGHVEAYAPPVWRWILAVIRRLPRFVMRRVKF